MDAASAVEAYVRVTAASIPSTESFTFAIERASQRDAADRFVAAPAAETVVFTNADTPTLTKRILIERPGAFVRWRVTKSAGATSIEGEIQLVIATL
jgi:hypothetical protein